MERLAKLPSGHDLLHADHDGSRRGSRIPRRDAQGQHQGRARRRRSRHARGAEGHLQGLQSAPATRWPSGCARSGSTACTCSARSSSACRRTRPTTFDATAALAESADITFAQFVMLTPFPGTIDFDKWEKSFVDGAADVRGHAAHAALADSRGTPAEVLHAASDDDARRSAVADAGACGIGSTACPSSGSAAAASTDLKGRLAFVLISKLYRQMYANTGIASDSARASSAERWARLISKPTAKLFAGRPMPDLQVP